MKGSVRMIEYANLAIAVILIDTRSTHMLTGCSFQVNHCYSDANREHTEGTFLGLL